MYSPYAVATWVKTCHNEKWKEVIPTQQSQSTDVKTDMLHGKQECATGGDET